MIDDFPPTASWENLRLRADLLRRLRDFFYMQGFLEVETPVLSSNTVIDRHLDPFHIEIPLGPEKAPRRMWLQTSPEFAMKRLLAAGAKAIYQISRVFREGEQGALHNPEFTMVEWYRAGDAMAEGMRFTSDLAEIMLGRGPARQISYREAFIEHAGVDPHSSDTAALIAATGKQGIQPPASLARDDRDGWLELLLIERVQPHLGLDRPVLLYDYPATQAALSLIRNDDPPVAERFELYVSGIELANGYHELLDPEELRLRNRENNRRRAAEGKPALPEQSRLLAAMESGLPPAVGVALGFDRLVMLVAGAKTLADVIAFPFDRA
ncbi:MAG: EF-P lysine aminoacylase EpmA [Thermoguttaceae bacterium]|jgi:lysyl-tRNA synthetase class 2